MLTRELGLSWARERVAREGCLRIVEVRVEVVPVGLSGFRLDGLRFSFVVAVSARLDAREGGPPLPRRAAEEAVGAVIDAGRLTGRVGDFVRGLVFVVVLAVCFGAVSLDGNEGWVLVVVLLVLVVFKDIRLGFFVGALAVSLSTGALDNDGRADEVFVAF